MEGGWRAVAGFDRLARACGRALGLLSNPLLKHGDESVAAVRREGRVAQYFAEVTHLRRRAKPPPYILHTAVYKLMQKQKIYE